MGGISQFLVEAVKSAIVRDIDLTYNYLNIMPLQVHAAKKKKKCRPFTIASFACLMSI